MKTPKRRTSSQPAPARSPQKKSNLSLHQYQWPAFESQVGTLVLHWSRQIGKSYVLAAWAVARMLKKLADHPDWLITVLSNSRDNGAEFCRKVAQLCQHYQTPSETTDASPNLLFENMRMEIRITLNLDGEGHVGRIKVLAANPHTARSFSGDLILDEFAFHDNSHAIWEAAEPILAPIRNTNVASRATTSNSSNADHSPAHQVAYETNHRAGVKGALVHTRSNCIGSTVIHPHGHLRQMSIQPLRHLPAMLLRRPITTLVRLTASRCKRDFATNSLKLF